MPFDKTKPYELFVDFVKQTRKFKQDGKFYTDSGHEIVDEIDVPARHHCVKCEFTSETKQAYFHHLTNVHHAPQDIMLREQKKADKLEPNAPVAEDPKDKFACKHCPSRFKNQQGLAAHLRVHQPKTAKVA